MKQNNMMMHTFNLVRSNKCSEMIVSSILLEILNGKFEDLFNFFNIID